MARYWSRLTRSGAWRVTFSLLAVILLSGFFIVSPAETGRAAAATTLIDDTFANSTSSSNVDVESNGTGADGQPLPCLTAAVISQSSPETNSTTPDASGSFTDQIATVGNTGSVTFDTTSDNADVVVSPSGAVSTTAALGLGPYTVSGTDSDGTNTGVWSYTLDVETESPIAQSAPAANTTTTGGSATFTDQLATTGNIGAVTFTTTTDSSELVVSPSGAVSTTASLPVGTYAVSGTDSDGSNTGTWSYTLQVTASPSSVQNCDAATPDPDGSGTLELTDAGFYEASNVIYGGSFPTVDGLDITFDAHMYGGTQFGGMYADGMSFDLAAAPPDPGAVGQPGGALGYSTDGINPGMPGGYLGVGLDEYGNYSTTTYEGSDCHATDPSWAGYSPNEVTVHGPGNGTSGYCLLGSSLQDSPDPLGPSGIQLHGDSYSSSEITVHIVIDTSDPSAPTYSVTLQPVGAASPTTVTSGPLPDFYYDPATGNEVQGIPSQLTFAVAASTGAGSDFHEINNLQTTTQIGTPLTTLALSAGDDSEGSVGLGDSFNYVLTPQVSPDSAVAEDDPVTLVDQLPATQILTATPSGTDWDCSATDTTTNTAECTYTPTSPISPGDTLPPVSVPAATTSGTPGDTVTDTASVSSPDALSYVSATDTVTLTAPNPLLDAGISDSDQGSVPVGSPAFTLDMAASVDPNGADENAAPVMSSVLPADLELTSTPTGTDWDCSASSGQDVSCTYVGGVSADSPLPPGTALPVVSVPVQLNPEDAVGDQFEVSEALSSADAAPYWSQSTDTETITVAASVQLSLTDTDSGTPTGTIYGGTPFTYILAVTVGSGGQAESQPITVTETTPTGVGLQAVPAPSDPNWDCSATNVGTNTVDCVYTPSTPIAPGTTLAPIVIPAFMADTNVGDVITDSSPTAYSADAAEAYASDTVTVAQAPVGLDLTVGDDTGGTAPTGTAFNYLVNVTVATGQSESDTITVTDPLPSGTELTALPYGTGWDCSSSVLGGNYAACTYAPPAGGVAPVTTLPTISEPATLTDSTVGDTQVNTAQAGSDDATQVTASDTITVSQASQAITFTSPVPADATVGGATYTPMATGGDSGNPVVITIDPSSAAVCSISSGVVNFTGVGTCTVDANQDGDTDYGAAPQQQQAFSVGQGSQAITFTSPVPADATVSGATYTPMATGGDSGNPVVITVDPSSAAVCSISSGVVSFIGAGNCIIDANQAGNTDYSAAPPVSQSIAVEDVVPTTLTQAAPLTGTATVTTSATFGATLAVTGATGTVTYTVTTPATGLAVSGTGAITTTGTLAVGTYPVSGTEIDADGDTGDWSFTLTVTAGTLTQATPETGTATVTTSAAFGATLAVTGATGTVTYTVTTPATGLAVTGTGAITTTGTLAVGTYTVSGTDLDTDGDTGDWSFALTVTAGTLTQATPETGTATVTTSAAFGATLAVTGATGTVTYTVTTPAIGLTVSGTGAITTTGTLAVGTYTVSGTDLDADGDTGDWSFTLTVTAGTLTQATPETGTATVTTSAAFGATLAVTGATGTVTYTVTTPAIGLTVSGTGAITTTGTLAVGTYTVSGTDLDADGDTGDWSFTLTVTAGTATTVSTTTTGGSGVTPTATTPVPTTPNPTIAVLTVQHRVPTPTRAVLISSSPPGPTPGGPPAPVSTKSAIGPQPTRPLLLSHATVEPGEAIVLTGSGCAPGSEVDVFVGPRAVRSVTANGQGTFSTSVAPPDQGAGQMTIVAKCGSRTFTAVVSVVATSAVTPPEGSVAAFGVFVLLGVVLVRGQFGSTTTARRRRKRLGATDILGQD